MEKAPTLERAAARRGVKINILKLDLEDPVTIHKAVNTVIQEAGGIYGLVNNAGMILQGFFEDLSREEIQHVFKTNVFGTMEVIKAVLPFMREAGRGRIIIVTSTGGRWGGVSLSAYCSTKFALEGLGESIYQEVMPLGLSVVLVEPGIIKTNLWDSNNNIAAKAMDPKSPYREWFENQRKLMQKLLNSSPNKTTDVAKTIFVGLTVKSPKLRYVVGSRAKIIFCLNRYLPGDVFQRIYLKKAIQHMIKK